MPTRNARAHGAWPRRLVLLATALLLLPQAAFAYLDPGTGSMILQTVLAALFGAAFIIKTQWKRLVSFFRKKPNEETTEEQESVREP